MTTEFDGFEMIQGPMETEIVGDNPEEQENESHRDNPAEEWPTRKVHRFYLVKHQMYVDPKTKSRIDQASIERKKWNQARLKVTEQLRVIEADRQKLNTQINDLSYDSRQIGLNIDKRINEINSLKRDLRKLPSAKSETRGVCSSVEDLDNTIRILEYRIQHETISLSEENKIIQMIKKLKKQRPQVIANEALRKKTLDLTRQKKDLQNQINVKDCELGELRKEKQMVEARIKQSRDAAKAIGKNKARLMDEQAVADQKRNRAHYSFEKFEKQRDDENSYFYRSLEVMNRAKELASKKDVKAVEELANSEMEKSMSLWNGSKSFRDNYVKRIQSSLDAQQLNRDEKPSVVVAEKPAPAEPPAKEVKKRPKRSKRSKPAVEHSDDAEACLKSSKPAVEHSDEEDAEALKEMRKQELKAKLEHYLKRKEKLAKRSAARKAYGEQEEAKKKEMKHQKRLKKKAEAAMLDTNTEAVAAEKESENIEAPPAPERSRRIVPKSLLKRKNSSYCQIL